MNPIPNSIFHKIRRVCLLDAKVYQETRQSLLAAFFIVLLVAISHGIGGIIRANINHWDPTESFVFGVQGELVFWLVQSLVYYLAAKLVLRRPARLTELLSAIGFAIFPGILVFGVAYLQLVDLSVPVLILLAVYRLVTCTLALQQVLALKTAGAAILALTGTAIAFFSLGLSIRVMEGMMN